jgi:hypothetical protein
MFRYFIFFLGILLPDFFLEVPPQTIADQLTLIDWNLFKQIEVNNKHKERNN